MAWNARANLPVGFTGFLSYNSWINTWKYGLQNTQGQAHCGAMPFRSGTGTDAAKCLRGEDWAFIRSVQATSQYIPDAYIWSFPGTQKPAINQLHEELNKADLTTAYNWLKVWEAQQAWGTGLNTTTEFGGWNVGGPNVPDYGLPEYQSADQYYTMLKEMIQNRLVVQMPNPANQTNLQLSTMQAMFADYKKLKCTVLGGALNSSGTPMYYAQQLLNYQPQVVSNTTWTGFATPTVTLPDQLIYLSGDLYLHGEFKQTMTDKWGSVKTKAQILFLIKVRSGVEFENRQDANNRYFYNMDNDPRGRISVSDVGTLVAGELGVPWPCWDSERPDPSVQDPQWTPLSTTDVRVYWLYYPCTQHWLVDY